MKNLVDILEILVEATAVAAVLASFGYVLLRRKSRKTPQATTFVIRPGRISEHGVSLPPPQSHTTSAGQGTFSVTYK
jgi:hypothetical protein